MYFTSRVQKVFTCKSEIQRESVLTHFDRNLSGWHTSLIEISGSSIEDRKWCGQMFMLLFVYYKCWGWNSGLWAWYASDLHLSHIPSPIKMYIYIFISGVNLLYQNGLSHVVSSPHHSFDKLKQNIGQYRKDIKTSMKWTDKWSLVLTWRLLKSLTT